MVVDLGAAGGADTITAASTAACGGSTCPIWQLPIRTPYESAKGGRNIQIVTVADEVCGDGLDNNGNGLIDETRRGCTENGVQTGSSVDLASGNLTRTIPLLTFAGSLMPLDFTVSYNSLDSGPGRLGKSSTHTYQPHIRNDNGVTLALVDRQGGWSHYRKNGTMTYYPMDQRSAQDRIVKQDDGSYERIWPDGRRWCFNTTGRLTEIRDQNQNAVHLTYVDNGLTLTQVEDPSGRTLAFTYDGDGRVVQVTDSASWTVSFVYDPNGTNHLLTIVDATGGAWSFTYDTSGRMLTKTDLQGGVTAYTCGADGRLAQVTDPTGAVRQLVYDLAQKTTRVVEPGGATRVQTWDGRLNVPLAVTDPTGRATRYTHDVAGNRLSTTDPAGHVTSYTYDAEGRLLTTTNPLSETTTLTYDPATNRIASRTGPDGLVTRYAYDPQGNLLETTDPAGGVTHYAYDSHGNITHVTTPANQVWAFTYNTQNQLTRMADPSGAVRDFSCGGAPDEPDLSRRRGAGLWVRSGRAALDADGRPQADCHVHVRCRRPALPAGAAERHAGPLCL